MTYNPSLSNQKKNPHSLIQNLQQNQRIETSTPQRNTTSGRVNRNAIASANLTMSIKEQQAIQDILKEMRSQEANSGQQSKGEKDGGNFDYSQITEFDNDALLDYDLEQMLRQSEQQLSKEYESLAKQQFAKNRMSIVVDDEQDKLQEIFARMDIRSEVSKQSQSEEQIKINLKHGHNLQVKKRKQSTFSRDMSQDGSYVRSFDQKSEGFGSAFNLDENKLKLHYGYDDYFIQDNKTSGRARSYTTTLQIDPQKGQENAEDNSSSDSSQQKIKSKKRVVQQSGKWKEVSEKQQYILDRFQKDEICKPKEQSLQILQLDQKYPKINPMSMYKYQYPIFNITESSTNKYLRFLKREVQDITCAVSFFVGAQKWTILGIDYLLYVFIGDKWKEPLILNPQRSSSSISKAITVLTVSPSVNYLALGLGNQIIIYQIKKETSLLVLVKNLNSSDDLNAKLVKVNKIVFYDENPIKLVYNDNDENIGIITVEQNMLYTKVSERNVDHGLDIVMDFDTLCIDVKSKVQKQEMESPSKKGFSFNKMFNQKLTTFISKSQVCYLALASNSKLVLFSIQPNLQLLCMQNFEQETNNEVSLRWRYNRQVQIKPQLLISYHNKIFIYKLFETDLGIDNKNKSKEVSLQLHLMYQNHYNIKQMEIISNTHLLLYSNENIIVIAIPLITSTHLTEDKHDLDMSQSALIWITSQKNLRILFASPEEIIYFGSKKQTLRLACLKTLQQYLDELMLQQGHFRQAFTLLILIFKGVNYSFKFSYTSEALSQCIFSAVQCTIGSLIVSMDDNIAEYRLGWVCQLLLQTHNQQMIWTTVYKKLKDKQKQRQKQEYATKRNLEELDEMCKTEGNIPGENYYEHFIKTQAESIKKTITKRQSSESHSSLLKNRQVIVRHHSLVMQHTTSSKLGFENHKSLEQILFNILEVFVLKSQVTSMPEQIFLQFVAYQCQKKSDTVVEKAIIQNKAEYDGSKLLSLLHSKERSYLQFYLFSRALVCEEPDFYTPFIKVFSSFKQSMEQIERRSKNEAQLLKKTEKIGMMCLWFIRKCFKFERIPSGVMPLNQKLMIISTMCTQLLQPTFTIRLFSFQPKMFLQIYLLFFIDTEISQLIEQHNQMLVEKYKQFFPSIYQQIMSTPSQKSNEESKEQEEQIFDKSFKQLAVLHLELTIPAIKNQKFVWSEFLATVYYCNKSQMGLKFEVTVDILIVLFQNKFEQYQLEIPNKVSRPTIEELELTLIQHIKPILLQKKDRFYLNKLISLNDKNVSYYLCRLDQNYKQSLEYFMASKQPEKMIPFIHELLQDVKEIGKNNCDNQIDKSIRQRKIGEIKNFLVKNITYLFRIDKYGALNVFYEIGETSQTIYSVIEESMGQKLNFLTAVLKKFQNQDFQMKERFQLEHLSEVCRLKDKQMLEYLDKFFYPLDQAIIVCEQKGNLLAKAILQQRCGKINEAFMSYERIVKNIISSNSSQKEIRSQRQVKRDMRKYTQQCIRLCKQYSQDPNSNQQSNFWLRIITFINGFIKSNSQHKVFLKVEFEKVLQHILTQMFEFLPTNILVEFFITKGYKLQLSATKQFSIFQNLFVLSKFDMGVAKKVVEICRIDNKDTRKEALYKRKNGIKCNGFCDFCKKQLTDDPYCSIYACKHSFHKLCHDDPFKCLTCYFQSDNSVLQSNIFGTQLIRSSLEHQIFDQQAPKQKKKLKQMSNINIIVESAEIARIEAAKKKLKLHDFNCQQQNIDFYSNISNYEEKEKVRESLNKMQEYQNEYVKYTKAGGLEIKEKEKLKINENEHERMSKDRKNSDSNNNEI